MNNINASSRYSVKSFIAFIISGLKEINPWQNMKSLHTNITTTTVYSDVISKDLEDAVENLK